MSMLRIKELNEFKNLDQPSVSLKHREIILKKVFLKKLYIEWYGIFQYWATQIPDGKKLEIGSGGGFLKDVMPDVITSDIFALDHCDLTFSAEEIPFENESLSAIFMIDVLHHIPKCEKFFEEANRTLKNKGKIIMIEPACSMWSNFIWTYLHHEPFNPKAKDWAFPSTGPLSGSNIALPWIIFERDITKFEKLFTNFKLKLINYHSPFRYLLSGGVSFVTFVPDWSFNFFAKIEQIISPLNRMIGMFQTIVVEKET